VSLTRLELLVPLVQLILEVVDIVLIVQLLDMHLKAVVLLEELSVAHEAVLGSHLVVILLQA
jgi:hypothetical protein